MLLGELNQLSVWNTTGTNQDHTVSSVVGLDVAVQVVPGDGLNVLLGSEDSAAERLVLVCGCVKVIENDFL